MCGRYKFYRSDKWAIAKKFGVRIEDIPDYADEIDNAPGSWRSAIQIENDERMWTGMRWGFDMTIQGKTKTVFNTKVEGVMESKLWKPRFVKNRCIIPATGFIEWKKVDGKRVPGAPKFDITVTDQECFGFAGLWGTWTNPKTRLVEKTFSIFTTDPNEMFAEYHNRQPVILEPGEFEEWLAPSERPPAHLLRIFPAEKMVVTQVENPTPMKAVKAKAANPEKEPLAAVTGSLFPE